VSLYYFVYCIVLLHSLYFLAPLPTFSFEVPTTFLSSYLPPFPKVTIVLLLLLK